MAAAGDSNVIACLEEFAQLVGIEFERFLERVD
jgi:hypothetical protein